MASLMENNRPTFLEDHHPWPPEPIPGAKYGYILETADSTPKWRAATRDELIAAEKARLGADFDEALLDGLCYQSTPPGCNGGCGVGNCGQRDYPTTNHSYCGCGG